MKLLIRRTTINLGGVIKSYNFWVILLLMTLCKRIIHHADLLYRESANNLPLESSL